MNFIAEKMREGNLDDKGEAKLRDKREEICQFAARMGRYWLCYNFPGKLEVLNVYERKLLRVGALVFDRALRVPLPKIFAALNYVPSFK